MTHKLITAQGTFTIRNDRGLHTRPSTEIVKCTVKYTSEVVLYYRKKRANAKSLLGILMFAASKGAKIRVKATGEDANEAIESLMELAEKNFNMQY